MGLGWGMPMGTVCDTALCTSVNILHHLSEHKRVKEGSFDTALCQTSTHSIDAIFRMALASSMGQSSCCRAVLGSSSFSFSSNGMVSSMMTFLQQPCNVTRDVNHALHSDRCQISPYTNTVFLPHPMLPCALIVAATLMQQARSDDNVSVPSHQQESQAARCFYLRLTAGRMLPH